MKLTAAKRHDLREFMDNPYYREIIKNAPNDAYGLFASSAISFEG